MLLKTTRHLEAKAQYSRRSTRAHMRFTSMCTRARIVLNLVQLFIDVLNVKPRHSELLLFASLPDCSQNQTAISDTQRFVN